MKIAAWNLNHRTNPKPVPDGVGQVVRHLAPDVLVLTEYVDSKASARSSAGSGLVFCPLSARKALRNRPL